MKLCLIILCALGVNGMGPDEKLVGLGVFARHGHRFSNFESIAQNLRLKLTSIGQRQHYLLGKYLRKTYSSFFDE